MAKGPAEMINAGKPAAFRNFRYAAAVFAEKLPRLSETKAEDILFRGSAVPLFKQPAKIRLADMQAGCDRGVG